MSHKRESGRYNLLKHGIMLNSNADPYRELAIGFTRDKGEKTNQDGLRHLSTIVLVLRQCLGHGEKKRCENCLSSQSYYRQTFSFQTKQTVSPEHLALTFWRTMAKKIREHLKQARTD